MNCKPGDLAVIVAFAPEHPHLTGRIVEVIELAPTGGDFKLPDGKFHRAASQGCWVIRFQNAVDLSAVRGKSGALYAACHDSKLRPLRDPGEDVPDESTAWLPPVPLHDEVTV